MTIQRSDIKLFQPQRLTDNPDGGGRMTGTEVVDGQVNNLFPDISRLDRVYGRVNLRKPFTAITTNTRDIYYGAHTIVDDSPDDPNVSITLFSTGSHVDERADARNRIESYVTAGPDSAMRPLGDQLEGQRSITVWQREGARMPEIGEVYVLSVEDDSIPEDGRQQYVRVQDVSADVQTFTTSTGSGFIDFDVLVITLSLSTALRDDFPGKAPTRDFSAAPTLVRSTQVANAAQYYGIQPVTQALTAGDVQIPVADVYVPLVPSTQSETPQTDVQAGATVTHEEQSNGETVEVQDFAETEETIVTLQNRGLSFVKNLTPLPAPGTLVVEFRALGNWNRLTDRGDGKIEGDGTGTIDYGTGSVSVTLAAPPDANTSILWTWGTPLHYTDRGGSTQGIDPPVVTITPDGDMKPGTLTITWLDSQGATKTATDDGAGSISGDASGRVVYTGPNRQVDMEPATLPDPSTVYNMDYEAGASQSESFTLTGGATNPAFTLSSTSIVAGSVTIRVPVEQRTDAAYMEVVSTEELTRVVRDDGAGNLVLGGSNIGTIDYGTGDVAFDPTVDYDRDVYAGTVSGSYSNAWGEAIAWDARSYDTETVHETIPAGALARVEYADAATAYGSQSASQDAAPIKMQLTRNTQEIIKPGTVKFDFAGDTFIDRKGQLYRSVDASGAGILAGTINYETGAVTLSDYPGGTPTLTVRTMLTQRARWTVSSLFFRTPGAPVKPLSFYLQVSDTAGNLIEATADANGNLDAAEMNGKIDTETGIVQAGFGKLVADSSLTTEQKNQPWYDPGSVDGDGNIWMPTEILPSTASFNAVILSTLPLDADLLGLDPVRLPGDGRVPIYQEAGVVVVHNTQSEAMPSPLSAGQTVTLTRGDLALVYLEDDTGATVDRAQYTVDLAAGEVTMAGSGTFDLSSYTEPLHAYHRIEDMLLVTDVQIDGRLTVNGGVTRDYPADTTYCSSALIFGDLQSRVTDFFTQASWDGATWKDTRQGDDTTASYNLSQYPIQVENQHAIKERWALDFTSSTTFDIVGETVGVIGTGDTATQVAPTNPETGGPYFTIEPQGFGSGWQVGNVIRFNTEAAAAPIWVARTILAGDATGDNDSFRIQNRGDAD